MQTIVITPLPKQKQHQKKQTNTINDNFFTIL